MDKGFSPARGGLESIKQRLAVELERELPPGLGDRLEKILDAALEFHPHGKTESKLPDIDFCAITGESLLPQRDDSFGAADFLKLSQVFERSLVGLIASSELPDDEKSRFTNDILAFFDGFDTALLGRLEEELITRGLLRPAPALLVEPVEKLFGILGYPKDLADEMTDPVLIISVDTVVYANSAAKSIIPEDALQASAFGPDGVFGESIVPANSTGGEWTRRIVNLPTRKGNGGGSLAVWKTVTGDEGDIILVILPTAGKPVDSRSRMDILTKEKRRFKALYQLSKELLGGFDVEALLARLSKILSGTMQFDALLLHLCHNEHNRAMFHLVSPQPMESVEVLLESSISTLNAFVPGVDAKDIDVQVLNPKLLDAGAPVNKDAVNMIILPLAFKDEVFGTLGFCNAADGKIPDEDLHLFSTFCNQFTLALKNAMAIDGMRKLLRDNREQIDLARRVQMKLLPEPDKFSRLKFRTLFNPAAGLSGDFYNFFTGPDAEGLVIGDASGHGISASLIMAAAGATFRDVCTQPVCDPEQALLKANRALLKALGEDFFVVALVFSVNPERLKAKYASSGHPGPFHISAGGRVRWLNISGLPLGMFDTPGPYDVRGIQLKPGDRMLFFTDGAIENRDEKGRLYGVKRLRKAVKKSLHLNGDEFLAAIAGDISSFLGDLTNADDMTLVLMEVE